MFYVKDKKIDEVCKSIGVSRQLAKELLLLAGGRVDLVITCSMNSNGLDHCKANIINQRFDKLENGVSHAREKRIQSSERTEKGCFREG